MATQTLAELKTTFNTWLQDSDDITFTSGEKDEFLAAAIRDPWVYKIARDSSITTVADTYSYALPTGFSNELTFVGVDVAGVGFPQPLDRRSWYVEDGYLYLERLDVPASKAITIRGKKKLTTSDTFPDSLQNYVLHLAMVEAFRLIQSQLTTRFYKNDITMAEVSAVIGQHKSDAAQLRSTLENRLILEA